MLVLPISLTNCSFSQCPAKFTGANFKLTESIKGCIVTGRAGGRIEELVPKVDLVETLP
jgi:hypothetical protein